MANSKYWHVLLVGSNEDTIGVVRLTATSRDLKHGLYRPVDQAHM